MNTFDKVIGYKSIKQELQQICDMIRNRTVYEEMGARLPHGLLLYGDPGLGKTLLAKCLIEESGLNAITVRRVRQRCLYQQYYGSFCEGKGRCPGDHFSR